MLSDTIVNYFWFKLLTSFNFLIMFLVCPKLKVEARSQYKCFTMTSLVSNDF